MLFSFYESGFFHSIDCPCDRGRICTEVPREMRTRLGFTSLKYIQYANTRLLGRADYLGPQRLSFRNFSSAVCMMGGRFSSHNVVVSNVEILDISAIRPA
jgi:hypothetical protein